ncbi:hypothetical protein Syun_004509 [Stephania yunnanensis]|uniref:Kinesin motor domain-containing protein n=1 Tax=Stephania yunnanensis TaxID=152371 RepID=A0AAP0L4N4_9MAGN
MERRWSSNSGEDLGSCGAIELKQEWSSFNLLGEDFGNEDFGWYFNEYRKGASRRSCVCGASRNWCFGLQRRVALEQVESVKATSDVNSPISGEVVEINTGLTEKPDTINSIPYEEGWMIKVKPSNPVELDSLLGPKEYEAIEVVIAYVVENYPVGFTRKGKVLESNVPRQLAYGAMVYVRKFIVSEAFTALSRAVCIATRYSAIRRRFGLHDGGPKTQVQIRSHAFTFDHVCSGTSSSSYRIFEDCVSPLVDAFFKVIMPRFRIWPGKTYTMGTNYNAESNSIGIIPKVMENIFSKVEETKDNSEFLIRVSFIEIFKEEVFDLLEGISSTKSSLPHRAPIQIRETTNGGISLHGVSEPEVLKQSWLLHLALQNEYADISISRECTVHPLPEILPNFSSFLNKVNEPFNKEITESETEHIGSWQDVSHISGPDSSSKLTPLSQMGFDDPASVETESETESETKCKLSVSDSVAN